MSIILADLRPSTSEENFRVSEASKKAKMEVIAALGKGSCGSVNLVSIDHDSKKMYLAVKSSNNPASIVSLKCEKDFLDAFRGSTEIVQCLGEDSWYSDDDDDDDGKKNVVSNKVLDANEENPRAFLKSKTHAIFLEYMCNGSLADFIKNSPHGKLPEPQVRRYTKSILKGIALVHANGYVHCDVKPKNILVASSKDVKIADFDLAKRRGERLKDRLIRGTPCYVAPEGVARHDYEPPADVWSLGCTVVEMLTGKPPRQFPKGIGLRTVKHLIACNIAPPKIPEKASPEAKDFLRKCLAKNPKKRWTTEMLLKHPFVSDDIGGLSSVHASQAKRERPTRSRIFCCFSSRSS